MRADLIIPVCNQLEFTKACLESIRQKTHFGDYRLIVVDNASTDGTADWLREFQDKDMTIITNGENVGFTKAINQGIKLSQGDYIGFLNNDIVVGRDWLTQLVRILRTDDKIGAVGPVCSNNHDWQGYDRVKEKFKDFNVDMPEDCNVKEQMIREKFSHKYILIKGMLAFFCTILPSSVVREIGLLDELFTYTGDDDDYARRLEKAGYKLALSLGTYVKHSSETTASKVYGDKRKEMSKASLARLKMKWPEYYGGR